MNIFQIGRVSFSSRLFSDRKRVGLLVPKQSWKSYHPLSVAWIQATLRGGVKRDALLAERQENPNFETSNLRPRLRCQAPKRILGLSRKVLPCRGAFVSAHLDRKGFGKQAFRNVVDRCGELDIEQLIIVSDPDAEGFYLNESALPIGEVASIPQNRLRPQADLSNSQALTIALQEN